MNAREALKDAEALLAKAGVPDARLDAEYLLSGVLHCPRLSLRLENAPISREQAQAYKALLNRRQQREPLQYILGCQFFMGLEFLVTPDVLIPRQDTETLCELALDRAPKNGRVLDLCTGSGALAVALAALRPDLDVTASDISPAALAIAQKNAGRHHARVAFFQGDLFTAVADRRFDCIVSNPPYIPTGELPGLQAEVCREPALALDGGADGLAFYRRIIGEAPRHLSPGGGLLFEMGDTQFEDIAALLKKDFETISLFHDLSGRPRVVGAGLKG